jgi:hypothetical protein
MPVLQRTTATRAKVLRPSTIAITLISPKQEFRPNKRAARQQQVQSASVQDISCGPLGAVVLGAYVDRQGRKKGPVPDVGVNGRWDSLARGYAFVLK